MKNSNSNPKYIIEKVLYKNSLITIYKGINLSDNKPLIIKCEINDNNNYLSKTIVQTEWKNLDKLKNIDGIPKIVDYYKDYTHNYLVTNYLGKDLQDIQDIQNQNDNKFSLGFCSFFMSEMINLLKNIHENNTFHCDLKPSNFIFNIEESKIFLIDFSVSQNKGTKNTHIIGTPKFCSYFSHDCLEYSSRDDLISLGYVALYFLLGFLPWQKNKMHSLYTLNKIKEYKGELLTFLKSNPDIPEEFTIYFNYCYSLETNSEPEYVLLQSLFIKLMNNNNYSKTELKNEIEPLVSENSPKKILLRSRSSFTFQ